MTLRHQNLGDINVDDPANHARFLAILRGTLNDETPQATLYAPSGIDVDEVCSPSPDTPSPNDLTTDRGINRPGSCLTSLRDQDLLKSTTRVLLVRNKAVPLPEVLDLLTLRLFSDNEDVYPSSADLSKCSLLQKLLIERRKEMGLYTTTSYIDKVVAEFRRDHQDAPAAQIMTPTETELTEALTAVGTPETGKEKSPEPRSFNSPMLSTRRKRVQFF